MPSRQTYQYVKLLTLRIDALRVLNLKDFLMLLLLHEGCTDELWWVSLESEIVLNRLNAGTLLLF